MCLWIFEHISLNNKEYKEEHNTKAPKNSKSVENINYVPAISLWCDIFMNYENEKRFDWDCDSSQIWWLVINLLGNK